MRLSVSDNTVLYGKSGTGKIEKKLMLPVGLLALLSKLGTPTFCSLSLL